MLTLLMATHNGSATLPTVLDAYGRLEPPKGGWRLVIVDNGSTDPTREIATSFSQSMPLEYVFEPRSGKNAALNTGLGSTSGDLVVFTDDDAVPKPDWLRRLRDAADSNPQFSFFAGCIIARWEIPPARWILDWVHLGVTYALSDSNWLEGPINCDGVSGCNMAIRAGIFEAGYRFDPSIGPQAGSYPMGSEQELLLRLSQAGHAGWYCPQAVVEHMIRRSQMTKAWVLSRAIRYGRGQMRFEMLKSSLRGSGRVKITKSMIRAIGARAVKLAIAKLRGDAEASFRERWLLQCLAGRAIEWRASHKGTGGK